MQSIGQILQDAREKKGITLSQAAHDSKIKLDYLEKLEANQFDRLIAPTYARSFLQMYAQFLGLDSKPLVEQFRAEHAPQAAAAPAPVVPKTKPVLKFKVEEKKPDVAPANLNPPAKDIPPRTSLPMRGTRVSVIVVGVVLLGILFVWNLRGGGSSKPPKRAVEKSQDVGAGDAKLELMKVDPAQAADTLKVPQPR